MLYLSSPAGRRSPTRQRDVVDAVERSTASHDTVSTTRKSPRASASTRWRSGCRRSVPELMDFSNEPQHVLDMYGTKGADGSFAANCLLARRLAERGVRFIQLYHRDWDHHGGFARAISGQRPRKSTGLRPR